MRLVSLFSGIGAFEKAFERTNIPYELVGFSEIDKYAIQSYCAIHNVDESLNLGDVSQIRNEDLPQNIDMVTYGFPCQDISISGYQKGITGNTRSGLLFEAERIIEHTKPKFAIAENVKNLVGKKFKDDFDALLDRLDSYGYNNYWSVLNAKDHGIPQNRERVFILSVRKDVDTGEFQFPEKQILDVKLKDILLDEFEEKYIIKNDKANQLLQVILDESNVEKSITEPKLNRLGGWNDTVDRKRQSGEVYGVDGLSPTLNTMQGGGLQPHIIGKNNNEQYFIRKLMPLECWKLMGFDDEDYWKARTRLEKVFYKGKDRSNSQMYKQAGNSIVVNVIEQIYQEMRKARLL